MAMRLSGLMSGMDTESLIGQLVEARSAKVTKTKKAQIKLNWQQDAWKELNTKLKNLQSKFISNMRFSSSYSKKVTKVSNPNAVSVITGESAVNGVQSLEISQLAKTGYLTGAELKGSDGESKGDYTALTKLKDLNFTGTGSFSVNTGKGSVEVNVDENTTISDVLSKLKEAGLNASFDTKSQRFFVSAKESGKANDFSITASDAGGFSALSKLGLQAGLSDDPSSRADTATYKKYSTLAGYAGATESDTRTNIRNSAMYRDEVKARTDSLLERYKSLVSNEKAAQKEIGKLEQKYSDKGMDIRSLKTAEEYQADIDEWQSMLDDEASPLTEEDKAAVRDKIKELKEYQQDVKAYAAQNSALSNIETQKNQIRGQIDITETPGENGAVTYEAEAKDSLKGTVEDKLYRDVTFAKDVIDHPAQYASAGATKVSGEDAIIKLNGATFENSTNTFEINGLTFTAISETKPGEAITVTTEQDTNGIYDMVKSFLKEYNSIINEMDKLYNAASAKGYDPLVSEEKEKMSETEVAEYEKKIKDSLLRRDSNLSSISSAMKGIMSSGFSVGGKTMYLSDFGINTLGYFSAPDNEKNAYHIDGDPDDGDTAGNADKLKGLIASNPDAVISFFTQLSQSLYDKMTDLSKSVDGYRSFGSFYDDKKMKSDYDSYTTKISEQEKKLNDYEDKWYKKFSKMETAMAKMQRNANAISGLIGGGS